jgi:hypothetical protein
VTSCNFGRDLCTDPEQCVTQVFTAACAVGYSSVRNADLWEPLARLALHAAYEGTLWGACQVAERMGGAGGSRKVFLTLVGGGVFGNKLAWICDAVLRAVSVFREAGLQVCLVLYQPPVPAEVQLMLRKLRGSGVEVRD